MRARALVLLFATLGCSAQGEPRDELDAAVIDELSTEQGSAAGVGWTGSYASTFTSDSCDCPTVTLEGTPVDLCSLVEQVSLQLDLVQADGFLVATTTETMLTGAIEADGGFVIAGRANLSTVLGPIERLSRMDGILELVAGDARLSATAGQRLLGEFAGESIDCRWLGTVEATRVD